MTETFRPRGTEVRLPHGGLPEVIPPYLQNLIEQTGGITGPIGLQFVAQPDQERRHYQEASDTLSDPLMEDQHLVAPGLVYKYRATFNEDGTVRDPGRALWTITFSCSAYCRFCTRGREIGLTPSPRLSKEQIDETLAYIENEPGLNEVILSGGDPMTLRPEILKYVLGRLGDLQRRGKLEIVRIGTRLPVHNPVAFKEWHYETARLIPNLHLMVHINHPAELTQQTLEVLDRFRRECGAVVMSQTVLLKGVNDNPEILKALFRKLAANNIVPYYVYQNDPLPWAEHFTVPLEEAIAMWQMIRPTDSGVADTANFVIDTPGGFGKIPVPKGDAWVVDYSQGFKDFHGQHFEVK